MKRLPGRRTGTEVDRQTAGELAQLNIDISDVPAEVAWIITKYPHVWERVLLALKMKRAGFKPGASFVRLILGILDDSKSVDDEEGAVEALCSGYSAFLEQYVYQGIMNVIALAWLMNDHRPLQLRQALASGEPALGAVPLSRLKLPAVPGYTAAGSTPMNDSVIAALLYQLIESIRYRRRLKLPDELVSSSTLLCSDGRDSREGALTQDAAFLVRYMLSHGHEVIGLGVGPKEIFRFHFAQLGIENIFTAASFRQVLPALVSAGQTSAASAIATAGPVLALERRNSR
jgi:hypothetical protein